MMALMIAAALAAGAPAQDLTPLLQRARLSLADAREMTDLQVCAPQQVSRDGTRYTTLVSFSVPRQPRRYFRAVWREGRVVQIADTGVQGGADGLAGLATAALERRFETCRWVGADELAAAWSAMER